MNSFNLASKSVLWGLLLLVGTLNVQANNFGLSLNYGNGGYTGAPVFGFGANYGSVGAIQNCLPGSVINGYIPPVTSLPQVRIPDQGEISGRMNWGGGGGGGWHQPMPIPVPVPVPYPVPMHGGGGGGTVVNNHYDSGVIDTTLKMEYHKNDTASILWPVADVYRSNASTLWPVPIYNTQPRFDVDFYSRGSRSYSLEERDLGAHY